MRRKAPRSRTEHNHSTAFPPSAKSHVTAAVIYALSASVLVSSDSGIFQQFFI